jgi:hypothetical protein
VGDDSHVIFGQKFPGEKGSVRQCVVMMQKITDKLIYFSIIESATTYGTK